MTRFRMFGIHIDQFAILSSTGNANDLGMGVKLDFKYAEKGRVIACSTKFDFSSGQNKLMVLGITCEFEIEGDDLLKLKKKDKIIIPKELLEFFVVHTIGTARGVLFCKTESSPYNNIIIPPLNVAEMIKDNLTIKLSE